MLGFFNPKNNWKTALQAYNLLALTLATYELATNPDASQNELGADIVIHAMTIINLGENTSFLMGMIASWSNAARFGAICSAGKSGYSSVAGALESMDALNHLVNMLGSFVAACDDHEPDNTRVIKGQ